MTDLAQLRDLIAPEATALGFALVRVAWIKGEGDEPTLQIMAERPETGQLNIDDCAALSRRISNKFDELDPIEEAYRLEVSSPGIDRPLTRLKDFANWAGHEARVDLSELVDGRKSLRGDLIGVEGDVILIDDRKSGRIGFAMDQVESAKLILTDRLIKASVPVDTSGIEEYDADEGDADEEGIGGAGDVFADDNDDFEQEEQD